MYMSSYIFLSLIPPEHAKTREPKDEHCVLQCINAIHNMGAHLGLQN